MPSRFRHVRVASRLLVLGGIVAPCLPGLVGCGAGGHQFGAVSRAGAVLAICASSCEALSQGLDPQDRPEPATTSGTTSGTLPAPEAPVVRGPAAAPNGEQAVHHPAPAAQDAQVAWSTGRFTVTSTSTRERG